MTKLKTITITMSLVIIYVRFDPKQIKQLQSLFSDILEGDNDKRNYFFFSNIKRRGTVLPQAP